MGIRNLHGCNHHGFVLVGEAVLQAGFIGRNKRVMLLQIVNHKPTVHTSLRIYDRIKRTAKTGEAVKNAFTTLPSHKGQLDVVAGSFSYLAVTLHGLSHIALDLIHIRTHDVEWTVQTSSFVSGLSTSPIGSSLPQEVNTTGEAIIIRRMAIERYFFIFMTFRF